MTYFYNKSYKRVAASNFLDSSSDEEEENRRTSSVQTKMSLFDSSATLPLCLLPLLQQHQPYTVHRRHHKLGSSPWNMKEARKLNSTEVQVTLISVFIQHHLRGIQLQMKAALHLLLAPVKKHWNVWAHRMIMIKNLEIFTLIPRKVAN